MESQRKKIRKYYAIETNVGRDSRQIDLNERINHLNLNVAPPPFAARKANRIKSSDGAKMGCCTGKFTSLRLP